MSQSNVQGWIKIGRCDRRMEFTEADRKIVDQGFESVVTLLGLTRELLVERAPQYYFSGPSSELLNNGYHRDYFVVMLVGGGGMGAYPTVVLSSDKDENALFIQADLSTHCRYHVDSAVCTNFRDLLTELGISIMDGLQ